MRERRWCEIALRVLEQHLEVETSSDFQMAIWQFHSVFLADSERLAD